MSPGQGASTRETPEIHRGVLPLPPIHQNGLSGKRKERKKSGLAATARADAFCSSDALGREEQLHEAGRCTQRTTDDAPNPGHALVTTGRSPGRKMCQCGARQYYCTRKSFSSGKATPQDMHCIRTAGRGLLVRAGNGVWPWTPLVSSLPAR